MGKHSREASDFEDSRNTGKKRRRVSKSDDGNDPTSSSTSESKIYTHTSHKLSKPEIESLLKRKWKYNWTMRALGTNTFRWNGTGEREKRESLVKDAPYGLRQNMYDHWLATYGWGSEQFNSSMQISFFKICGSYRDILHHQKKRVKESCAEDFIMESYVMHSLNHVFKTRDLVVENSKTNNTLNEETGDGFRDQGFPQPKVLILIPFRSTALRLVKKLVHLTPSPDKVNVELMDQFEKDFGSEAVFRDGEKNHFVIGISLRGNNIKLYSDLYSSDIIIASPAGLSNKIKLAKANKGSDLNYLSSVEILVVDLGDVYTKRPKAQWVRQLHIRRVVKHLSVPATLLRPWYDDGRAQFYRQTILLCSNYNYDFHKLFHQSCLNYEGKLRLPPSKETCCTLALTYPVGYKLKKQKENSALVIDKSSPNNLVMHGFFDVKTLKEQKERFSEKQIESVKFSSPFKDRLRSCMGNQGPKACLKHIRSEIWKHCKNIPCVNMYSYAKFAVSLFRKYKFNMMLSFIFRTILEGSFVVTRHSYRQHDWIGIKLSDLIDIAATYPPLTHRGAPDALSFQLIRKKAYTFLHEMHVAIREDGGLAKRSEPRVYFNEEKEEAIVKEKEGHTVIPLHTIILFIPDLNGLLG